MGKTSKLLASVPEEDAPSTDDAIEVKHIPYGANRGRRSETQISSVGGGHHLNIYLADELIEVARTWPLGADVDLREKRGEPDVLCFRKASQRAYALRGRAGTARPHFTVRNFDAIQIKMTAVEFLA